jgi:hypothetical protein
MAGMLRRSAPGSLNAVGSAGGGGWLQSGIASNPGNLPDAVPEFFAQFGGVQLATGLELVHHVGTDLGEFLFQSELGKESKVVLGMVSSTGK